MKKTIIILGVILLASILVTSCKGNDQDELDKTISLPDPPKDIKYVGVQLIDGPLSEYLEVVEGEYLLELEKNEDKYLLGYDGQMKVKFRFLKSIDVKAGSGYNSFGPSLLGDVQDEQGKPLDFTLEANSNEDLARFLKRGSGEEWITLNISGQGGCDNAEDAAKQLEEYKKGKKIRFNSEIVEEKFDSDSSSSSESNDLSSSSGDCDEFLEGYEEFMDNYVAILKKYKNNPSDMSILSDYTSLTSEAQEWATKTAECANDPKYASKLSAIQMKIATAMQ